MQGEAMALDGNPAFDFILMVFICGSNLLIVDKLINFNLIFNLFNLVNFNSVCPTMLKGNRNVIFNEEWRDLPDSASLQGCRHRESSVHTRCEDCRHQAILWAVGSLDGLLLALKAEYTLHRTKDLIINQSHVERTEPHMCNEIL